MNIMLKVPLENNIISSLKSQKTFGKKNTSWRLERASTNKANSGEKQENDTGKFQVAHNESPVATEQVHYLLRSQIDLLQIFNLKLYRFCLSLKFLIFSEELSVYQAYCITLKWHLTLTFHLFLRSSESLQRNTSIFNSTRWCGQTLKPQP